MNDTLEIGNLSEKVLNVLTNLHDKWQTFRAPARARAMVEAYRRLEDYSRIGTTLYEPWLVRWDNQDNVVLLKQFVQIDGKKVKRRVLVNPKDEHKMMSLDQVISSLERDERGSERLHIRRRLENIAVVFGVE